MTIFNIKLAQITHLVICKPLEEVEQGHCWWVVTSWQCLRDETWQSLGEEKGGLHIHFLAASVPAASGGSRQMVYVHFVRLLALHRIHHIHHIYPIRLIPLRPLFPLETPLLLRQDRVGWTVLQYVG